MWTREADKAHGNIRWVLAQVNGQDEGSLPHYMDHIKHGVQIQEVYKSFNGGASSTHAE